MFWFLPILGVFLTAQIVRCEEIRCPDSTLTATDEQKEFSFEPFGKNISLPFTCTLTLTTEKSIQLSFKTFKMGDDGPCNENYIVISTNRQPALTGGFRFCGDKLPILSRTHGKEISVTIHMTNVTEKEGFIMVYEKVETLAPYECVEPPRMMAGVTYVWPPLGQPIIGDCTTLYSISVRKEQRVRFDFTEFQLPSTHMCANNYVQFGEGMEMDLSNEKKCGTLKPFSVTFNNNRAHVALTGHNLPWGYHVAFKASELEPLRPFLCDPTIDSAKEETIIDIPGVDGYIPPNFACSYHIRSEAGKTTQIKFPVFEIAPSEKCISGYVDISVGKVKQRYCGDKKPSDTIHSEDSIYITVNLPHQRQENKMRFEISKVDTIKQDFRCEQKVFLSTDEAQILQIPNKGGILPRRFRCRYKLEAPLGKILDWSFTKFEMGNETDCKKNVVYVGEEPIESKSVKLCGSEIPRKFLRDKPRIYIIVKGVALSPKDGFAITFKSGAGTISSWLGVVLVVLLGLVQRNT